VIESKFANSPSQFQHESIARLLTGQYQYRATNRRQGCQFGEGFDLMGL
jgi:hypothetical protein